MLPDHRLRLAGLMLMPLASMMACATFETMMINSNRSIVNCRATGGGALGIAMAFSNHDTCIQNYRSAGYILLSEAGSSGIANLTSDQKTVSVLKVADNSPASRIGIAPGDIIVKVRGQSVTKAGDAMTLLFGRVGEKIDLLLSKDGQEKPITLVLDPYEQVYGTKK